MLEPWNYTTPPLKDPRILLQISAFLMPESPHLELNGAKLIGLNYVWSTRAAMHVSIDNILSILLFATLEKKIKIF